MILKTVGDATERYRLENGVYPAQNDWDSLDISLPEEKTSNKLNIIFNNKYLLRINYENHLKGNHIQMLPQTNTPLMLSEQLGANTKGKYTCRYTDSFATYKKMCEMICNTKDPVKFTAVSSSHYAGLTNL